jgi:hypothetical protein
MDGDPSQEDRIRLTGRLFFIYSAVALKDIEIERGSFVNFSQNILRNLNFLGSIWGQWGQILGQESTEFKFSHSIFILVCQA